MSEWNYTKCAKPFDTLEEAESYMRKRDFAGYVLKRTHGYSAVCPTYPDGYYVDAVTALEIENSQSELRIARESQSLKCC